MKSGPQRYFVLFLIFAVLNGILIFFVEQSITQREKTNRQINLEIANSKAVSELGEALDNFATLVSGIRSQLRFTPEFPAEFQLQNFLKYQIAEINFKDSLIISYVDTSHIFRYSFTPFSTDPSGLKLTSVRDIVGEEGVQRLDAIMKNDSYHAFAPFNLVEGKVGFPLDFGIIRDSVTVGYISAITDFKSIINRVYNEKDALGYVYHFKTEADNDFDRERVYDGTRIYTTKTDPEYYKNFNVDLSEFHYTAVPFYNTKFVVGTAYKVPFERNRLIVLLLAIWYSSLVLFLGFAVRQLYLYRLKNMKIELQRKQLAQLSATRNKFFSIVAHDIKNPLAAILTLTGMLKEEKFENDTTSGLVSGLNDATKNTMTLLDNILDWSRVERNEMPFEPNSVDASEVLEKVLQGLKIPADVKDIDLISTLKNEVSIWCDRNMLATIFRNLVSNSIKFTPIGGKVIISSALMENERMFMVRDNGIGMAPEEMETIFQVNASISKLGTNNEQGTGLGLVLCKQFLEYHQGRIWVESTPEKGTTIFFTIPLHPTKR